MKQQLRQVERQINHVSQIMTRAQLRRAVQRYFSDGTMPQSEPAKSFVEVMATFQQMADSSCGGNGYEAACEAYEAAVSRHNAELAKAGLQGARS